MNPQTSAMGILSGAIRNPCSPWNNSLSSYSGSFAGASKELSEQISSFSPLTIFVELSSMEPVFESFASATSNWLWQSLQIHRSLSQERPAAKQAQYFFKHLQIQRKLKQIIGWVRIFFVMQGWKWMNDQALNFKSYRFFGQEHPSPTLTSRPSKASGLLSRITARALVAAPSEEFPWTLLMLIMKWEWSMQK